MIDLANITIKSGNGGSGAGSFMHIKGKRRGKADGGDGGRGGDVYFEATLDLNTLEAFRFNKDFKAKDGVFGLSNMKKGANGEDLVLKVPVGTEISVVGPVSRFPPTSAQPFVPSQPSGSSQPEVLRAVGIPSTTATHDALQVYDLVEDGQKVLAARGGQGGRGNAHLRDEYGRRPLRGEKGENGEILSLKLELKLIADVGLIGLPNAGKSTLLAALTSAKPEIASYPFTTLEPNLGVVRFSVLGYRLSDDSQSVSQLTGQQKTDEQNSENGKLRTDRLVLADIPGLIEGASEGRGLGHRFLRHIERTKILVHLIDTSSSEDLWEQYQKVRNELKKYSKELSKKKEIIAFNKADLVNAQKINEFIKSFGKKRKKAIVISAEKRLGFEDLIKEILGKL